MPLKSMSNVKLTGSVNVKLKKNSDWATVVKSPTGTALLIMSPLPMMVAALPPFIILNVWFANMFGRLADVSMGLKRSTPIGNPSSSTSPGGSNWTTDLSGTSFPGIATVVIPIADTKVGESASKLAVIMDFICIVFSYRVCLIQRNKGQRG